MQYTGREQKLISLMLNQAALGNEVTTSCEVFIKSLRSRAVTAEQMVNGFGGNVSSGQSGRERLLQVLLSDTEQALRVVRIQRDEELARATEFKAEVAKLKAELAKAKASTPVGAASGTQTGTMTFDFGKYRGAMIQAVPIGYLQWALETLKGAKHEGLKTAIREHLEGVS
jgi:hypothetical protein